MKKKLSSRASQSVARRHVELAWAAPQVIAHRTARMMAAGAAPTARDAAEFKRMFAEKAQAFSTAWVASWVAMCWAPWRVSMELLRARTGVRQGAATLESMWGAWQRQGWRIAGAGIAPVHRTAVANARRLAR